MPGEVRQAMQVTPPERLRHLPSWLVSQVGIRATRLVHEQVGRPGARADFAVLSALHEFGAMSQAELGRRLGLDRSDIAAVLDRLEADQLAERRPDDADRRRNVIVPTAAAGQALEDLQHALESAQSALLEPLSTVERTELVRLLQQVVDAGAPPPHAAAEVPSCTWAPASPATDR